MPPATDREIKDSHITFPDPRCELYFERALKPIADALAEVSSSLATLTEGHEKTAKTVHGENYDNGMVQAVREHTLALKAVETLPKELRSMVLKWGFYLLGANGVVSAIAISIILALVKGG
jgi:hypothetical protein